MHISKIKEIIEPYRKELEKAALEIHSNPETGMEEYNAVRIQLEILRKWNFDITERFCSIPTSFKAVYGKGSTTICFMSEYDALPGLGHACGHNLIMLTSIAASKMLADIIEQENLDAKVVLLGTPGEEGMGGKIKIIEKGGLAGIDAVLMAHPDNKTATWKGCFGVQRYDIDFLGKAAHAADAPEHGINALDAVIMLFNGVNAWREHLPENTRIHGIITDGGEAPNIVPEKASASFYLRAEKQDMISSMTELFENIAKGAALMTGCSLSFQRRFPSYKTGIPDEYLNELFYESAKELGMNPQIPENASRASTDFADVSHELPGIHVYFDITENKPYALHTKEFLEAAATPYAINQSFRTASALAYTAYRYIIEHKDKMH